MLDEATLLELQAALRGGAGPAEAVAATCAGTELDAVARAARMGRSLGDVAADAQPGDPAAAFLMRSLALTERVGGGGAEAVEHALTTIRDEVALRRLLDVRTAQARGTAHVLAAIPLATWLGLVLLDGQMLAFYASPLGWLSGGAALGLATVSWRWMHRLTGSVARRAADVDLLARPAVPVPWRRVTVAATVAGVIGAVVLGPVVGGMTAAGAGSLVARRHRAISPGDGGAAEAVALVAVGFDAGLGAAATFAEVSRLAPPAAVPVLSAAARRISGGWSVREALADTPLAVLGVSVAAAERWGAPVVPALRALAADLRAQQRTAVELAAERLQLVLIFPTTLLTLPAFVLGVVPPLLWATLQG